MEDLFVSLIENSITLGIMFFAWTLAERRAKNEREKVEDISSSFVEYLKAQNK